MTKEQFEAVVANYPEIDRPHLCWIIDTEKRTFQIVRQKYRGAEFNDKANIANPKGINFCSAFAPQLMKDTHGDISLYVQGTGGVVQTKWFPIPMNITWDDLYNVCKAVNEYNKAMKEDETKKDTFGHPEFDHWYKTKYMEGYIQAGIKSENLALDFRLSIDPITGKKSLTVKIQKYRWGNFNPTVDFYTTDFRASNGVVLTSITHPEWFPSNQKTLFLRGTDKGRDDVSLDVSDMSFSELREIYMAVFEYNVALFKYEQKKATPVLSEKEEFLRWYENTYRAKNRDAIYGDNPALRLDIDLDTFTLYIKTQKYHNRKFNPVTTGDHDDRRAFTSTNGFSLHSIAYPHWYTDDPSRHNELYLQGETKKNEKVDIKGMPYSTIKKMFEAVHEYNEMIYRHEKGSRKVHVDPSKFGDVTGIAMVHYVPTEEALFTEWYLKFKDEPLLYINDPAMQVEFDIHKMTLKITQQKYRRDSFNPMTKKDTFQASNGFILSSVNDPDLLDMDPALPGKLFVRGRRSQDDNRVMDLSVLTYPQLRKMLEAVREYNDAVYIFEQARPVDKDKEAEGTEVIGNPDHLQISMTDKTIKVLSLKHKGDSFSSPHTSKFFSDGFVFSASKEILPGIYLDDMRVEVNFHESDHYDISGWSTETRDNFKRAIMNYNTFQCNLATGGKGAGWNLSYILMGIE